MSGKGFHHDRLRGLMLAKGLHWKGLTALGFEEQRVKSWLYTDRSPRTIEDALKIADWLEVPVEYLFGFATPQFEGLDVSRVASQASLERFLASRRDLSHHVRQILESYGGADKAPCTVAQWRALYDEVVAPARALGHAEAKRMEAMSETGE